MPTTNVARQPTKDATNSSVGVENRFERVVNRELWTATRKRGGVLVDGSAPGDAPRPARGKSRRGGGLRGGAALGGPAAALSVLKPNLGVRVGGAATPTVALAPPPTGGNPLGLSPSLVDAPGEFNSRVALGSLAAKPNLTGSELADVPIRLGLRLAHPCSHAPRSWLT